MRPAHRLRVAVNAGNGSTLAGIAVACAGRAGLRAAGEGLLVGSGYRLTIPKATAFCLGNVLITKLDYADFTGNSRLFAHEARHATQYACCAGVVMLPLYGLAAAVSWLLTGDFGSCNVFEQRAGLADGGYEKKDLRPFLLHAKHRVGTRRDSHQGRGIRWRRLAGWVKPGPDCGDDHRDAAAAQDAGAVARPFRRRGWAV